MNQIESEISEGSSRKKTCINIIIIIICRSILILSGVYYSYVLYCATTDRKLLALVTCSIIIFIDTVIICIRRKGLDYKWLNN